MKSQSKKKNDSSVIYVLSGDPIAWSRAGRSKTGRIYDPQKQLKLINGISLEAQHGELPHYSGPLHLDVVFYMRIPPTSNRKYHHHVFKPDLDNLIKWIGDISNKILFHDDCSISKITARKVYDFKPRTEFSLEVLD